MYQGEEHVGARKHPQDGVQAVQQAAVAGKEVRRILHAALALHGSRSDIFIWHRYYIPAYTMAAILAAMGAQAAIERLPRPLKILPLAVPALLLALGWQSFDRSRYRIAEDFSRALLGTLPPGSHLIATDDNILFVLMYLHFVEGERPDINLILQGVGGGGLPPGRPPRGAADGPNVRRGASPSHDRR